MTFQFLCPQGHLLQGEEAHMGMQCQCPQCGVAFIIPTVERSQQFGGAESAAAAPGPQIDLAPLDEPDAFDEPSHVGGGKGLEGLNAGKRDSASLDSGHHSSAKFDSASFDSGELDTGDLDDAAVGETLLHIACPNGHELEVPLDMIGERAMCPHCQAEFRLRREKSVEYMREQEVLDRKRAEFWFKLAIIAAGVVCAVLVIMFLAMMVS